MATQIQKLSDKTWTKLSDIFTLAIGSSYVLEPEHGKGVMLLAVSAGGAVPGNGSIGHMVNRPASIVNTLSVDYYVRLWQNSPPVDLLLTPNIEFASPVIDGRQHYTETALDVIRQDNKSRTFDARFHIKNGQYTTFAVAGAIDDRTITVASATGFTVGMHIVMLQQTPPKATFADIIAVNGNVLTLNVPLDTTFTVGSEVVGLIHNMNVNGATTPVLFTLRDLSSIENLDFTLDVTRLMIRMVTSSAPGFDDFGDITGGLTRGILLQLQNADSDNHNMWVAKTNADLGLLTYDTQFYTASLPINVNGVMARNSYNGDDKHGAVLRLHPGDDLKIYIQDDLSSLVSFDVMAQGHLVTDD